MEETRPQRGSFLKAIGVNVAAALIVAPLIAVGTVIWSWARGRDWWGLLAHYGSSDPEPWTPIKVAAIASSLLLIPLGMVIAFVVDAVRGIPGKEAPTDTGMKIGMYLAFGLCGGTWALYFLQLAKH
jgi:hypothetical protein